MPLSKQSLRQGVHVILNHKLQTKDELIELSKTWTEKQEVFFRKMLQQGGVFRMNNQEFIVKIRDNSKTRSDGSKDSGVTTIPGGFNF